jgi:hypothetical protein
VKINQTAKSSASVSFTEAEFVLLSNALNEVLNGFDVPEFDTRLGASKQETEELLHQISSLLSKIG